MTGVDVQEAISRAHREEWARVVAALSRRFGDLDIAELRQGADHAGDLDEKDNG